MTDCDTQDKSHTNLPNQFAIIIGAMKGGTTSLFEILSQHPEISACKVKEPDYFVKTRNNDNHNAYTSLWNWQPTNHKIALESSVAYTKSPYIEGVPERIYQSKLGNFKFIYILRHPVKRIESQIRHGLFAGWEKPLRAGIPKDALAFSGYAMQLSKYLAFFPKESILVITLEEFNSSPNLTLTRICNFLEVDPDFHFKEVDTIRNSGEFFNASKSVAVVSQSKAGQFIAQNLLHPKIKNWLRSTLSKSNTNNALSPDRRWRLSKEETDAVLNSLRDDLKTLKTQFGIDAQKHWNIKD